MSKFIFEVGDKVWSPIYGNGVVTEHCYDDDTMRIHFNEENHWWYTYDGKFHNGRHNYSETVSLFPAGSHIVEAPMPVKECEEKKPTFAKGDKLIWLKPVKVEIIEKAHDGDVFCKVTDDCVNSKDGETWWFNGKTGVWNGGSLEDRGILVHPGFKVESGPEPDRKPTCNFKDKELVLVRDSKCNKWKITAFKGYDPEEEDYPYDTYEGEGFRYCIPYYGNEDKLGEVTEN